MYAKSLDISAFKAFGKAKVAFQYPGRRGANLPRLRNVNLILGDNGGGKSSVLRALAIAALGPVLLGSGFVPYRLVRRGRPGERTYERAVLQLEARVEPGDVLLRPGIDEPSPDLRVGAVLLAASFGSLDRLVPELESGDGPILNLDNPASSVFVIGYGATRRVETGEFSQSTALRSRGVHFQRVAGLFEDHLTLRPLQAWLPRLQSRSPERFAEAIDLFNAVLPGNIRFKGEIQAEGDQFLFDFDGVSTPFSSLSDGYKAFIGWVGDLIGQLAEMTLPDGKLVDRRGIVLVDEIDLHLHPSWQREVVPALATTFPMLQFVFTSHSALIASTVERENVFVTETAPDGSATIVQLQEKVFGRSMEQLLLSSYFGLETTRPEAFEEQSDTLFRKAAEGDSDAALRYLDSLIGTSATKSKGKAKS